ncbi:hypothetical protein DSECCO2_456290 [anaerobic digester metagenome]|nr:IPExxxVDY family protein [Lentimicrobiaceae bacterium]
MAKKKLPVEPGIFPDLNIIGIAAQIKDYRLAFLINNLFGFKLKKKDDLPIFIARSGLYMHYPIFTFKDANLRVNYYLMGNTHAAKPMVPTFKHADYLMLIMCSPQLNRTQEFLNTLQAQPEILLAFSIEKNKVKNLEDIMIDLELHMANSK